MLINEVTPISRTFIPDESKLKKRLGFWQSVFKNQPISGPVLELVKCEKFSDFVVLEAEYTSLISLAREQITLFQLNVGHCLESSIYIKDCLLPLLTFTKYFLAIADLQVRAEKINENLHDIQKSKISKLKMEAQAILLSIKSSISLLDNLLSLLPKDTLVALDDICHTELSEIELLISEQDETLAGIYQTVFLMNI